MATKKDAFHEDDGTKLYEIIAHVCFKIRGSQIAEVSKVNSALSRFKNVLKEVKIKEGSLEAHVISVENFQSQQKDLSSLTCSNQLKFSVSDDKAVWASNRTHKIEPLIHSHLQKLKLSGDFGGSEFDIQVIDSINPGEYRESHWPLMEEKNLI